MYHVSTIKDSLSITDNSIKQITEGIIMGEEAQGGEEECNIGLSLGIGRGSDEFKPKGESSNRDHSHPHHPVQFHMLFPAPHPKEEIVENEVIDLDRSSSKRVAENEENASNCKKNKTTTATSSTDYNMNNDNKYGCSSTATRKKLRLTKEQSTLLEDSFKQHNTLNQMQKHELAQRLDLRPRQVEVWFQNRRARTKLKQTEVDCEFLKKCCESLSDENRRLKKELQELRTIKFGSPAPFYVHLPKSATLTMCPECEKIAKINEDKGKGVIKTNKLVGGDGLDDSSTLVLMEKQN